MSRPKWTPIAAKGAVLGLTGACFEDQLSAWGFLIRHNIANNIGGWLGQHAHDLVVRGVITKKGRVNWYNADLFRKL